ncbi:MAG: GTP cyclohydrolase FolE2 [Rubrivivax sp.]|nr:GTP cyclohydrolase FolE2 [Rubrivivax sp.]
MNKLTDALHIPDTQSAPDGRHLAIQRVGIKDLRYPLQIRVAGALQSTAAVWSLDVALPADKKGTHMSRFVAWLDALATSGDALDAPVLRQRHAAMLDKLGADEGRIEAAFSFFLRKRAPVSGVSSLLDYEGRWIAETRAGSTAVWCEVAVPVKTLCPCSKEISDYGAHNQRSRVTIRVEARDTAAALPWEQLVRFAEDNASSELWSMLKRSDEKWVTERAYENPKFVEDLVRDVALALDADARIGRYTVDVENFESIHNHSAYARIERL